MKKNTWNEIGALCLGQAMLTTGMRKSCGTEEIVSRLRGIK